MEYDKIGNMSQAELRRFVVNLLLSDPAALPAPVFGQAYEGDVPVWNAESRKWLPSSQKKVDTQALNWHVGATPPANPVDGMSWTYSGNGFYWEFRYNPAEVNYKWVFVGGGWWWDWHGGTTAQNLGGAFTNTAANITIPFAGDYSVAGGSVYIPTSASGQAVSSGCWNGTSDVVDFGTMITTTGQVGYMSGIGTAGGRAASEVFRTYLTSPGFAVTGSYTTNWLGIQPLRITA